MAFRLSALLRGNAMGLGDLNIDSARRWRQHAVRLLRAHGERPPRTVPGRGVEAPEALKPKWAQLEQTAVVASK